MPTKKDYERALARLAKAEAMLAAHELDVEAAVFLYTEDGQPVYQPQEQELVDEQAASDTVSEGDVELVDEPEPVSAPEPEPVGYTRPNVRQSPARARTLNSVPVDFDNMTHEQVSDYYENVMMKSKEWR